MSDTTTNDKPEALFLLLWLRFDEAAKESKRSDRDSTDAR